MKYTPEIEAKIATDYAEGIPVAAIAAELEVSERSIIAKLSAMGVYKKKPYLDKRGQVPIKKAELIERIAKALDLSLEDVESLEKANKAILVRLCVDLEDYKELMTG